MQMSGIETIKRVREHQDKTLIAFSCGKDAIAAWLAIQDSFDDVIPYYLYIVPGLEFVNESLDYYERFFKTKITRLPNPSLHRQLNNFVFQPPERCLVIEQANLPNHSYSEVRRAMIIKHGLQDNILVADGVRAADSPLRRISITQYGPITWNLNKYHPVWDMKKDELIALLNKHNCKLPVDYKYFSRTFDGIDLRFLLPIKKYFPKDYQTILNWFPLAELEVFRYEHR